MADVEVLPSRGYKERFIPKEIAEFFGVKASYKTDGEIERFYYPIEAEVGKGVTGYKTKDPNDKKKTYTIGETSNVFGLNKFLTGGKRIIITEGEEDCMVVATALHRQYGKIYPVISMGGTQQTDFLLKNRDKLRQFAEVVLWFDNDEKGQEAIPQAARIIGIDTLSAFEC